jgi:hypothetical protein
MNNKYQEAIFAYFKVAYLFHSNKITSCLKVNSLRLLYAEHVTRLRRQVMYNKFGRNTSLKTYVCM